MLWSCERVTAKQASAVLTPFLHDGSETEPLATHRLRWRSTAQSMRQSQGSPITFKHYSDIDYRTKSGKTQRFRPTYDTVPRAVCNGKF